MIVWPCLYEYYGENP